MTKLILDPTTRNNLPETIPMPFFGFGGRLVLTLYWWGYKLFSFRGGHSYEETIKELNTPLQVQAWLYANIKYTKDKSPQDEWQTAERTFMRRKGDCEDWAVFANECLKHKYNSYFLCMYTKDKGHATYIIITNKLKFKTTSIGTYGYMTHKGVWEKIIPDWFGFGNFNSYRVLDEELNKVKDVY